MKAATLTAGALQSKAGLYRHWRTGAVQRVTFTVDKLSLGNGELIPLSATQFQVGSTSRQLHFDAVRGSTRFRFRQITADGDTAFFEPTEAFSPTPAQLADLVGDYYSPDAETTFTIRVEDGRLVLRRRPDTRNLLTPVYTDAFQTQLGLVRFYRDATGRVTELGISQARVYDLRANKRE